MKKGIDYGRGITNINQTTGIRYGIIPHSEVGQFWYDESFIFYTCECPACGQILKNPDFELETCPNCETEYEDNLFEYLEPTAFYYEQNGYVCEQSADDPNIFILQSPYYTTCQFCSPCAPGAGYIMDTVEDGVRAYCFGHAWFENGIAPYPVYDVKTNLLIKEES